MRPLLAEEYEGGARELAGTGRWMVSYADFITLMFVLFLVLYARLPKEEMRGTAGTPVREPAPLAVPDLRPIPRPASVPARAAPMPARPAPPEPEARHAEPAPVPAREALAQVLAERIAGGDVALAVRQEGVLLDIREAALFASGTAQPAPEAGAILARIAGVLRERPNAVVVEGHTDSQPIRNAYFPSNWELSAARAAAVVRVLQEHGLAADRLTAAGLADTHPKAGNETEHGRRENRRVSLLVMNSAGPEGAP